MSLSDAFTNLNAGDIIEKNERLQLQQNAMYAAANMYDADPFDGSNEVMNYYGQIISQPVNALYTTDGYMVSENVSWGTGNNLFNDLKNFENRRDKIDANHLFTPENNDLKALAADQYKIIHMFEKRLEESLIENGKMGLTELDIEALTAISSARTAIAGIKKQQVDIKRHIADIRLKQQQEEFKQKQAMAGGNGGINSNYNTPMSDVNSIGNSFLDNINAISSKFNNGVNDTSSFTDYSTINPDGNVDDLLGMSTPATEFENLGLRIMVDEEREYVIVDRNNQRYLDTEGRFTSLIPEKPVSNPIDHQTKTAINDIGVKFDVFYE